LGLAAAFAAASPAAGNAFEIRGTVTNGTTGNPVGPVKVTIVDPRHGMATEEEIRTNARGEFAAPSLSDEISMFLVQVSHQGVTYTEIVQPSKDVVEVAVEVFDTTASWDSVEVSLPHFMARGNEDTLSIDRVFVVANRTRPPKTVFGSGAGFKIHIPEDRLQITSAFATSLGFPISVKPQPTDTPGVYTIDYPFKPGETQVGISFDVAYPESGYVYTETLPHALEEMVVMTEDPEMEITSPRAELGEPERVRGSKAYRLTDLPRAAAVTLVFRGGSAPAEPRAAGHEIVSLRQPRETVSIALIASLTLLLVLVLAYASRSHSIETDRDALLASKRDAILARIARLDDLFEMGTVPERLYKEKRAELVGTLAPIMRPSDRGRPDASRNASMSARKPKGAPDAR
jgi:hypothetical protein